MGKLPCSQNNTPEKLIISPTAKIFTFPLKEIVPTHVLYTHY